MLRFITKKIKFVFTIPNFLTMMRFFMLIPIMHHLLRVERKMALIWMLISAATDLADGFLARKLKQQSDFGRIIDPLADKVSVLGVAAFMVFSNNYNLPHWFFIFILIRECFVVAAAYYVMKSGGDVLEAARPGKNSAFATAMAIIIYVLNLQPWGIILVWIAVVLDLYSTWIYYQRFIEYRKLNRDI